MSSSSVEITPELLAGFLDEAPEYLEMLDAGLMEFESQVGTEPIRIETPEDQDRMNTMFRAAHSLKGLAAAFGFDRIKELTHRMETFFDGLRMNQRTLASDGVDILFQVFDRLKLLVQELSEEGGEKVAIEDVLAGLDGMLNAGSSDTPTSDEAAPGEEASEENAPEAATVKDETQTAAPEPTEVAGPAGTDGATEEPCPPEDDPSLNEVFSDPELAAIFLETTCESVEELNQGLLGLEESPNDSDLLNKAFRCAHNIKGASGAAGLRGMNRLTHNMETMFDKLRSGRISLDVEIMNACFTVVDRLKGVLDRIREGHIEDVGSDELCDLFAEWTSSADAPAIAEEKSENVQVSQCEDIASAESDTAPPAPPSTEDDNPFGEELDLSVAVEFEEDFDEAAIQAYLIHNKLSDIGHVLSADPDLDELAGDSKLTKITFMIRTDAPSAEVERFVKAYTVKNVTVTSCDHAIDEAAESPPAPASQEPVETKASVAEPATVQPDAPKESAKSTTPSAEAKPAPTAPAQTNSVSKNKAPSAKGAKPSAPSAKRAKSDAPAMKTTETLRVDQDRLDHLMNLGGELVINRARFIQIHRSFREVLDGKNLGYLVDDIRERLSQLGSCVERLSEGGPGDGVDELASELAQLRSSVAPICSMVERVHELRTSMVDFDEALHALTRVSESIQKGIMGTRMVPIGPLFTRFRRVVRDIAKTNGKQIELVLRGETTELDKRMIDELGDPLTHMVRNSVDHGIETVAVREAAGKNPTGTLTLEACHRGNSICIEVTDDGAGINIGKIKAKILEKEMATPQQVESMTDRELIQYVFKPGFSTADKVTDVSGRGMGMDIVVNKIEKLSGTIEIDSTWGEGTKVVVKLPLTLAILTSLVARIGKGVYAIPLETVAEIITVRREDIQFIQKREVVRVRDRVVAIARFEDVFATESQSLNTETRDNDELTLVIIGYENNQLGLLVDELLGQDDVVIKSIAENYRNVKGIAGASIRGDGTVSLILDVGAMMEMASTAVDRAPSAGALVGVGA